MQYCARLVLGEKVYYYYYYYYYYYHHHHHYHYTNCTLLHCLNKQLLKNVSETGSTSTFRLK
jgi:hypothetical protein